ncbi:MAG: arginine-ornithine antiporter, partial [Pseudoleptotrichia goodfellowii]|nr:arginine-ornithine antiporter [Pseudoleptotrichia goodfellowii]
SLCTAAIFVSWLFVTLYQVIYSYENKEWSQLFIGLFGSVFYLWAIWASGIGYFLLCLTVYILGIYLYAKARKENGISKVFSQKESIVIIFIVIGALLSIYMLFTGQIAV